MSALVIGSVPARLLKERLLHAHATSAVPRVDPSVLERNERKRFERLRRARDMVLSGSTLREAAKVSGVNERRYQRIMNRYFEVADDGQIAGERIFNKFWRPSRHPKRAQILDPSKSESAGAYTGMFRKLVEENKPLREALVSSLRRKGKAALQVNRLSGRELRKLLVNLCRAHGVAEDQYPLSTGDKGLRALRRWITTDFLPRHASDWIAAEHGPNAAKAITVPQISPAIAPNFEAYVDWQLDEVKVEVRAAIEIINARGELDLVEVERFSIIRLIELGYRATLAYVLVLAPAVTAYDVGNLLWRALHGMPMPPAVLSDLAPEPGAGFPIALLDELRWKAPRRIYLDNALSHLATVVGVIVEHTMGAELHLGSPGAPKERPEIESRFSMQARRLFKQLPGTLGSGPLDPQRKRNDAVPVDGLLKVDELDHAYYVMLANENASVSHATNGVPAVERLRRAVVIGSIRAQPVPLSNQIRHMFFPGSKVLVHADPEHGRKPYVYYRGRVRYTSGELQRRYDLVGKYIWARADPDDLRVILLFDEHGNEICRAHGEGRWGILPHDDRMRRMALKAIDKQARGRMPQDGPLTALFARLQEEAPSSPKAAQQLAHCLAVLGRNLNGESVDTTWVAHLIGAGAVLDVAALCRPAANEPAATARPASERAEGAAPSTTDLPTQSTPSHPRMVPRNAVRRTA